MPARKNTVLKPDYSILRGVITLNIYENANSIEVQPVNGNTLSYHEIVGALEIARLNLVIAQTKINRDAADGQAEKKKRSR